MSDIAREANVNRGSLYNAYGSKEALFLKSYKKYAEEYLENIQESLSSGTLRERLEKFFSVAITNFCKGDPPRGCPTTRSLMELSSTEGNGLPEEARETFAALLAGVLSRLEAALRTGARAGEFKGEPAAAAEHILAVIRGLVVIERAFRDEAQLHRIAQSTIDLIVPNISASSAAS